MNIRNKKTEKMEVTKIKTPKSLCETWDKPVIIDIYEIADKMPCTS